MTSDHTLCLLWVQIKVERLWDLKTESCVLQKISHSYCVHQCSSKESKWAGGGWGWEKQQKKKKKKRVIHQKNKVWNWFLNTTMKSSIHPKNHSLIFLLQECKYKTISLRKFWIPQILTLKRIPSQASTFFLSRESYRAMETNRGSTSISNLKSDKPKITVFARIITLRTSSTLHFD